MSLLTMAALVLGGCFVGWHFKQPPWMRKAVKQVVNTVNDNLPK